MKRGSCVRVPTTSDHHQRLNVAGWVAPLVGWHGFVRLVKGNRVGFLKVLQVLHRRFPTGRIYLYADGPGWHKGSEIDSFLADHPRFDLEYLPAYHPALNPVDRLWKQLRYEVTTNRYCSNLDQLLRTIRRQQRHWSPQKIVSLCKKTNYL